MLNRNLWQQHLNIVRSKYYTTRFTMFLVLYMILCKSFFKRKGLNSHKFLFKWPFGYVLIIAFLEFLHIYLKIILPISFDIPKFHLWTTFRMLYLAIFNYKVYPIQQVKGNLTGKRTTERNKFQTVTFFDWLPILNYTTISVWKTQQYCSDSHIRTNEFGRFHRKLLKNANKNKLPEFMYKYQPFLKRFENLTYSVRL